MITACSGPQSSSVTNVPEPSSTLPPLTTQTTSPTITVSPTPIPFPAKFDLPEWISDPNVTVGMYTDNTNQIEASIAFINIDTGETISVQVPARLVSNYFWMPNGKRFGFLSRDYTTVFLVDTTNGIVEGFPIRKTATKVLSRREFGPPLEPLTAIGSYPPDDRFSLMSYCGVCSYFNSNYDIDIEYATSEIIVSNRQTGEVAKISIAEDYPHPYTHIDYAWSPRGNDFFVLYGNESRLGYSGGDTLIIYNAKGQKLKKFEGEYSRVKWSLDGNSLIYTGSKIKDGYKSYGDIPCILEIRSGEELCFPAIQNHHPNIRATANFNLSRDGNEIYYHFETEKDSGVCIYNRINENITCPTENISQLKSENDDPLNLQFYNVSPTEKYFYIVLGTGCIRCDYGNIRAAMVLRKDGEIILEGYHLIYSFMWRPTTP